MRRAGLPLVLLLVYGLAWAETALDARLLAFDDHPGQLYRLSQAIALGLQPWRLNPGWWAGYAELQFYPPGFAYAGAALHHAALGALDASAAYQVMLWVTFLLPGLSTFALLARVTRSPWLALPGAFLALTLSAGSRSGVEEGLRWGLVSARLGWGVLPLLALALRGWTERPRPPLGAAPLLAAILLLHPAHAPAGAALVLLAAAHGPGDRRARWGQGALLVAAALALAGFWLLPLMAHLRMTLPLAWGEPTLANLGRGFGERPLLVLLGLVGLLVYWRSRRASGWPAADVWLAGWAPVIVALIVLDAAVAQPLGLSWLPADRLVDGLLLALVLAASLALARLHRHAPRLPASGLAIASIGIACLLASWGRAEPALSLWPRPWPNEWPKLETIARGTRMAELWDALQHAPDGRILFVRSAVPLEHRPDWRRPHSHITALTPLRARREILNGTFTHPSPVAGLVYTGSAANRPITRLAEERDGVTLFGRPLEDLDAATFNLLAERLRISAVVALDEDEGRLDFVARNPAFAAPIRIGPFLLFVSREPRPTPSPSGVQAWRLSLPTSAAGWVATGMAYSPLWRAEAGGHPLQIRRDTLGLLEVERPAAEGAIELIHAPGPAEWAGLTLSAATGLALLLTAWRRRGHPPAAAA